MKLRDLKDIDKDHILGALGLQTRPSTASWLFGSLAVFGVGLLCGASLTLLLTPKSGPDLRREIGHRLRRAHEEANNGHPVESGI